MPAPWGTMEERVESCLSVWLCVAVFESRRRPCLSHNSAMCEIVADFGALGTGALAFISWAWPLACLGLVQEDVVQRSQAQPEPLSKESEEKEASSALAAPSKVTDIVYAPDSDYNEKLMKAVADEIYRLVTSRRIGPERKRSHSYLYRAREGILDVDALIPADSDENHKGSDVLVNAYKKAKLVPLQDEHAVVQECKSMLNNTRIFGDRREPLCLALNKTNESAGFVLRLFAPVSLLSEEMYDFRLGSSKAEYAFADCCKFILQLTMARLPGWVFDGLTASYAQQLQAALSLVFLIPLVRRINAIQYEFSTGTADHQGVMGLSDAEFFWGHYLTCFLIGIVESLSAALMMLQAKYQGSTFAHGIDPSLLIVSFIIFQIGFSLVPILLTWVFPKGMLHMNKDPARFEEMPPDSKVIIDINGLTKLKGAKRSKLAQSVTETLCLVGIGDKANRMPKELSGGMKRRLSMAMTLVSQPDLLILDEPSAGMDPETRRNVWDVLQKVAKQRTLLLSSHDMEEADAIADQIVIMAAGVVVCTGSTTFLKKACGVGYKVTFTKVPHVFKLRDAMAVVQRTIPHAVVDDDKKEEVCIALGTMEIANFPGINMDWAPGGKGREDPVDEKVIEAVSKPISKQRTMTRSFSALFHKRLLSLVRSWDLYVVFFLGPLVLLALATWLRPQQSLLKTLKNQEETLDVPIKLGTHFPDSTVVLGEAPATDLSKALRVLIESESCTVRATGNVTKELHKIIENDFAAYTLTYPNGCGLSV
ncbi:hypothetical protein MRX96_046686 [Rhipicephalus microplus]